MAKDIPATIKSEIAKTTTRPGFLVYIGFSTPLRLCSWGSMSYSGYTWDKADVDVIDYSVDASGYRQLNVVLGNNDNTMSAIVLSEDLTNVAIKAWKVYFDSDGDPTDPYLMFSGVANGVDLSPQTSVVLKAITRNAKTLFSPRKRVCKSSGFHYLPYPGQVIVWGSNSIVLE